MGDGFTVDNSELDLLTADLTAIAVTAPRKVKQATEVSARKIKDAWAGKLKGEDRLPHAPRTITYDIHAYDREYTIGAEIGAERGRSQAPIVTVIEFGAPGNNTAPRGYGHGALKENEADYLHGLELAIEVDL